MLVISRKADQTVEFPELGVVIRVLETKRTRVQIGIEAPRRYQVMRGERIPPGQNGPSDRHAAFESRCLETSSSAARESAVTELRGRAVKEFQRIESQLAALAELADSYDRQLAREVAGDAMHRLARLRGVLLAAQASVQSGERIPRESMTVAERGNGDRLDEPVVGPAGCVREVKNRYRIGNPSRVDASPPAVKRATHRSPSRLAVAG